VTADETSDTAAAGPPGDPVRLSATAHGDGTGDPPLVLLHAFPLDASMWDGVLPGLRGLGRVLTVDLPGFGGSPLPAVGAPSLDVAADGVLAVLDAGGHERAVLAGCSMGGYVALALAGRHPERVAGLALVDTKAEADGGPARDNRERIARTVAGDTGTRAVLPMLDTLLGPVTRTDRPDIVAAVRGAMLRCSAEAVAWAQRAMAARADSTDLLPRLRVPAAVVVGEDDAVTGPDLARAMAAALPDAVLTVVPRSGHLSPLERPDAVAAALAALVLRVRPDRGLTGT
jgi:pimeloyl-ACP methyl ester carboxylesterase